jgi:hypothetical protein
MAEEKAKEIDKDFGKKCAHTGASIKRAKRYYREGKYYKNKRAYSDAMAKMKDQAKPAEAEAEKAA